MKDKDSARAQGEGPLKQKVFDTATMQRRQDIFDKINRRKKIKKMGGLKGMMAMLGKGGMGGLGNALGGQGLGDMMEKAGGGLPKGLPGLGGGQDGMPKLPPGFENLLKKK